jgi:hypothetical protein
MGSFGTRRRHRTEPTHKRIGLRAVVAFAALAAIAVVLTPAGSAGTTNKPFAAVFGSTVVPAASGYNPTAGGTAGNGYVTLKITNEARNQTLGSSNVYAPNNVTITGADTPSVGSLDPTQQPFPAGGTNTLELRNLNLSYGQFVTVNIYVSASSCGTFTWNIDAHQSNDYNSNPGNALYFDTTNSSLTTLATGGCHLAWIYQPASANQSTPITDTPFTSSGTNVHNVTVALEDSGGTVVGVNTGTATLAVTGSFDACGTGCTPGFTGLTSTFQNGYATFPSFESAYTGTGFTATASAFGLSTGASTPPFVIQQNGTDCIGQNPCLLNTTINNSPLTVSGNGGNFIYIAVSSTQLPSSVIGPGGGCQSFIGTKSGFAENDARSGNNGSIDFTISISNNALKKAYGPNYGQPNVPICLGAMRLDANNTPIPCSSDSLLGWPDRNLTNGVFNGTYGVAKCGDGGYWWGVLGTFQDPISLGFDSTQIPLITAWGSSPDGVYRTFTVHEPGASTNAPYGWDGHFGY